MAVNLCCVTWTAYGVVVCYIGRRVCTRPGRRYGDTVARDRSAPIGALSIGARPPSAELLFAGAAGALY